MQNTLGPGDRQTSEDGPTSNFELDEQDQQHGRDSSTAEAPPTRGRERGRAFFDWIRGLGVVRGDGWLGGVCTGVANRLAIDPLIVRGVVLVIAVLGGPIVLVYALAWLLLPGPRGEMHANEIVSGRVGPAVVGIVGLALLSFLPLTQGFWYAGALYWGEPDVLSSVGRVFWTGTLILGGLIVILWVARHSSIGNTSSGTAAAGRTAEQASEPSSPMPPADPQATLWQTTPRNGPVADADAASKADADVDAAAEIPATSEPSAPPEPPAPPVEASAEELRRWTEQQALWKQQRAAWVADRRRDTRQRAAADARTQAAAAAEAGGERRRIRRLTRPRASGTYIAIIVGLAVVLGSSAALAWLGGAGDAGYAPTVGLGVAVLVVAAGMILAGALRRRSGVLAFFAVLATAAMLLTAIVPAGRTLILFQGYGLPSVASGSYAALDSSLSAYIYADNQEVEVIDVWQSSGQLAIVLAPGRTVRLDANTAGRSVSLLKFDAAGTTTSLEDTIGYRSDGEGRFRSSTVVGPATTPDTIIRLWQGTGAVTITEEVAENEENEEQKSND